MNGAASSTAWARSNGVAGGDGTQALVAAVAAEHDLPFLVISAGTRNHFALDLGLDRADPATCLEALVDTIHPTAAGSRCSPRGRRAMSAIGAAAARPRATWSPGRARRSLRLPPWSGHP